MDRRSVFNAEFRFLVEWGIRELIDKVGHKRHKHTSMVLEVRFYLGDSG